MALANRIRANTDGSMPKLVRTSVNSSRAIPLKTSSSLVPLPIWFAFPALPLIGSFRSVTYSFLPSSSAIFCLPSPERAGYFENRRRNLRNAA